MGWNLSVERPNYRWGHTIYIILICDIYLMTTNLKQAKAKKNTEAATYKHNPIMPDIILNSTLLVHTHLEYIRIRHAFREMLFIHWSSSIYLKSMSSFLHKWVWWSLSVFYNNYYDMQTLKFLSMSNVDVDFSIVMFICWTSEVTIYNWSFVDLLPQNPLLKTYPTVCLI